MNGIDLETANSMIAGAFAKGRELGLKPLSVSVVDAGGHLRAFQRQDGASMLRANIATAKAAGALALGVSSREIAALAVERPSFISALGPLLPLGIVPAAGGVIIVDKDGDFMGAIGVTGDSSDHDELCALAGIQSVGLSAQ